MELDAFFNPRGVVVIGATNREGAAGAGVMENLLIAGEKRQVFPVNPNRKEIFGLKCYPAAVDLPSPVDLGIIITPARTVPAALEDCGKAGIKAVIIIAAGFRERGAEGLERERELAGISRKYGIRIIGPNCMGVIRPSTCLNTTFFTGMPRPGNIAFLSQSGALGAGILDWAMRENIGFSAFVSLGSMLDIDFGELIDNFGEDPETRSIIIYHESIGNARRFMSAARGFVRTKPILVLKSGRSLESARAVYSHTGAMISEDLNAEAVFQRSGVVRVQELSELFNCASVLNSKLLPRGPDLAIITNGGGPAILAVDQLYSRGGKLAELSPETLGELNKVLPDNWSGGNPVDIREDATVRDYVNAIEIVSRAHEVNGIIVIYTPQGRSPVEVAEAILKKAPSLGKPILSVWIGANEVAEARQLLCNNNLPVFAFPEEAIKAYIYMFRYARNLQMLYETPEETMMTEACRHHLSNIIEHASREGRRGLGAGDIDRFLRSYGIEAVEPHPAASPEEATRVADSLGYPLVMKVDSPDVIHKSDAGGLITGIQNGEEAGQAYRKIIEDVEVCQPGARIDGVNLYRMVENYGYELIVGYRKDSVFGPVIAFGMGGHDSELFKDIAVGLPPLNQVLARRIIEQTHIYEVLARGSRSRPAVNLKILDDVLTRVSAIAVDFPEIKEMDINPIVIKDGKALVLDARLILDAGFERENSYGHLIIMPYPARYIQPWYCRDGREVLLRPIKPEDEQLEKKAYESLSDDSLRLRFFTISRKITHEWLTRYCNIDYDREMVIIAEYKVQNSRRSVGNAVLKLSGDSGEFGVYVAEDFRKVGLGLKLCDVIIGVARDKGLKRLYAIVLSENIPMINLGLRLGFNMEPFGHGEVKLTLEL